MNLFQRISWDQAIGNESMAEELEALERVYSDIFLQEGDLFIEGNLDDDWAQSLIADCHSAVIFIAGDLQVAGRLQLSAAYPALTVTGKTTAKTIEAGDCEMILNGGEAAYFVLGNGAQGRLDGATIKTPFLISNHHDLAYTLVKKGISIDCFNTSHHAGDTYDFYAEDLRRIFIGEVLKQIEPENHYPAQIDFDRLYEYMASGQTVLHPDEPFQQ